MNRENKNNEQHKAETLKKLNKFKKIDLVKQSEEMREKYKQYGERVKGTKLESTYVIRPMVSKEESKKEIEKLINTFGIEHVGNVYDTLKKEYITTDIDRIVSKLNGKYSFEGAYEICNDYLK